MKEIIIPETDNRGNGKIKFTYVPLEDGEKIFFEIIDKKERTGEYSLEFRIREGNHIEEGIRKAQQDLIRGLCRLHPKDKENAVNLIKDNLATQDEVFDNCFRFQMWLANNVHSDAVLVSEGLKGEIKEKFLPKCFSLIKEAFSNQILTEEI